MSLTRLVNRGTAGVHLHQDITNTPVQKHTYVLIISSSHMQLPGIYMIKSIESSNKVRAYHILYKSMFV